MARLKKCWGSVLGPKRTTLPPSTSSPSSSKTSTYYANLQTDAVVTELLNNNGSLSSVQPNQVETIPSRPIDLINNQRNLAMNSTQNNLIPGANITMIERQTTLQINNPNGMVFGSVNNYGRRVSNAASETSETKIRRTRTIDKLIKCKAEVNQRLLEEISGNIGGDWPSLFRKLDITDALITQTKINFIVNGVKEVIFQLLLDWQRNSDEPTVGKLVTVLWRNDYRECVVRLKNYLKESNTLSEFVDEEPSGENNNIKQCDRDLNVND